MSTLDKLFLQLGNTPFTEKMKGFIQHHSLKELYKIDIYALAGEWGFKRKEILDNFLKGVNTGLFTITWVIHCPQCGNIVSTLPSLYEVRSQQLCNICELNFSNQIDRNMELFFSLNESIVKIPEQYKRGYMELCHKEITETGHFHWKSLTTVKALDCINSPVFRELLLTEILPEDVSLEVRFITFMFIKVKHSTKILQHQGDLHTFRLIVNYFNIIYSCIKKHNGLILKTMGDTVVGVFNREQDALLASIDCQNSIKVYNNKKHDKEKVSFKMGLHSGSSRVVTLNDKLDYFGLTINTAHKLQQYASGNEIVLSRRIYHNKKTNTLLKERVKEIKKSYINNSNGSQPVYIIRQS